MSHERKKNQGLVIYTAIVGNYDQLKQPQHILEECDYICFTDQTIANPGVWQLRKPPVINVDNVRLNRFIKLMPHKLLPKYSCSIYVDGNIEIIGDISPLMDDAFKSHSIAAFSHPFRDCIYEEANFCMMGGIDSWLNIYRQIKKYTYENYPAHHGLIEANILIRQHHNKEVIVLMEDWWAELTHYSRRDQLSFNYVCWKNKTTYQSLGMSNIRSKNSFFKLHPHTSTISYPKRVVLMLLRPFLKWLFFYAKD